MKEDQVVGLNKILAGEEFKLSKLHPAVFACLSERIEDAYRSLSKAELDKLSKELLNLVDRQFRKVSPETMLAIQSVARIGDAKSEQIMQAYHLGMLSFAQLLVSTVAGHRVSDDFVPTLKHRSYAPYLRVLRRGRCSETPLAQLAKVDKKTMHRKIEKLKRIGAVDFCIEGGEAIYFLTPVARQFLESKK